MKRNRKNELDYDFIGDQNNPMTEEEAKAISDHINAQKAKASKSVSPPKKRLNKRAKSLV